MSQADLFELIDFVAVRSQVKLASSSVWKLVKSGDFPQPIGGRKRACWSRIQITDYLYQLSRYGSWSIERSNQTLDIVFAQTKGDKVSQVGKNFNEQAE